MADTAPPWWSPGVDAVAVEAVMPVKSVAVSVASLVAVAAGGVKGFNTNLSSDREKNYLINSTNYFIFLPLLRLTKPPKRWHRASPACPARRTLPPLSPPSRPLVLGWLLCIYIVRQAFKAMPYFHFYFFSSLSSPPQTIGRCLPRHSPPHPLCHNIPPTASADSGLIVVSCRLTAATEGQGATFLSIFW